MKTINIFTILAALFFVMIISGCSGTKGTSNPKIEGIEWKLETLNGKTVALKSGSSITLSFDGTTAKIGGTAVCNKYFGGYTKTDETLVFSAIGSTKMMCDDNLNESDYFAMLGSVDGYKISGGKLSLMSKGSAVAVFSK
ncbi:MAG TPA: META domain-containing protein [Ignavibacteria bacterium]|nr:META domain-containing protein [Ignavibacteria bacterium]HMQ97657.1 META domain-containing protein [Ignavibacteria bacterium]